MICKNCGSQIADDSAFCINCGSNVEQPQTQTQPQYQAQPQYVVQQQIVYELPASRKYMEYLDDAGSVMSRSITALVLTLVLPLVGWLVGLIMALAVKGTLGRMRRREVGEEELVTDKMRDDYAAAKRKAKTAKIISTINLILFALPVVLAVLYVLFFVVLGVAGSY